MNGPIWIYIVVFAHLAGLAYFMLGGMPILEKFTKKDEKNLHGSTRVTHKGSTSYVEFVANRRLSNTSFRHHS